MSSARSKIFKELLPVIIGLVIIVVVVIAVPSAVQYIGKASGTPANLVVNYEGVLGNIPHPWRNLAQGGEEPKDMLTNIASEVKALQPEYIRIDHIYDAFKVVSRDGSGNLSYNWSGLDGAVNTILATGAKPFLSLSYMPEVIATGDMISQPKDWGDWGKVVQATIEHYSGRGAKNIDGVIYEVWNEPDLFGDYKTYGDKNYLTMYEQSARAASRVGNVNSFEIGGPATTGLYQNWVERLIKFVAEKNLRMDFVSWHRYSLDLDAYTKDVTQARAWAENIPALVNLKYYVTEWGHNSEVDPGYDDNFGAIHTIAASRIMTGTIDRAFVFEVIDGPGVSKLWGRWGLLTHDKFGTPEKKPRYSAIQFLNSLAPFRLGVKGEGSWVRALASSDEKGNVTVMVVNYDSTKTHSEGVPVTFENLPKGNFKYTRKDFLGTARSIQVATTSATWKTLEYMAPNSATMLSLDF